MVDLSGATGATGPVGLPGDSIVGATGVPGAIGSGATGATGPKGIPGLQGLVGATGISGTSGDIGATGATGAGVQGIPGPQGPTGVMGPTGPQGLPGPIGLVGSTGPQGDTGETGQVGATGLLGPTGSIGVTGPRGATGPLGPAGAPGQVGLQGPVGPQGVAGIQGSSGPTGPVGATGTPGTPGAVGATGSPGIQGIAGPLGPVGSIGPSGPAGPLGASGLPGPTGASGLPGPSGATGPAGPQGIQGPLGPAGGPSGPTGPQGLQGASGLQGAQGVQGATGQPGPTATMGATGAIGPQGIQGIQGIQGVQGPIGPTGPQGTAGAGGIQGPQGTQGIQGLSGPTGPIGTTGASGLPGPTGASGPRGPHYDTKAAAVASTIPGNVVILDGYFNVGDWGSKALYKKAASQPAHNGWFQSVGGQYWEYQAGTEGVNAGAFGIVGDGTTDDLAAVQSAVDYALIKSIPRVVFPPCNIFISSTIHVGWGNSLFTCISFEGTYRTFATLPGTAFRFNCSDRMAINAQGGRSISFKNFSITHNTGRNWANSFTPYLLARDKDNYEFLSAWMAPGLPLGIQPHSPVAGITVDAYFGSKPPDPYPDKVFPAWVINGVPSAGIPASPGLQSYASNALSSGTTFENVYVDSFPVGIGIGVNDPNQNDFTTINHCQFHYCIYGIAICNSQSRNVEVKNVLGMGFHTMLTNYRIGVNGGIWWGPIENISCSENYQFFDMTNVTAGALTIKNVYSEVCVRLGNWYGGGINTYPLTLDAFIVSFYGVTHGITPKSLIDSSSPMLTIKNSTLGDMNWITNINWSDYSYTNLESTLFQGAEQFSGLTTPTGANPYYESGVLQAASYLGGFIHNGSPRTGAHTMNSVSGKNTVISFLPTAITSISWAAGTVTLTTAYHGRRDSNWIKIVDTWPPVLNGMWWTTFNSDTTCTFALAADPGIALTSLTYTGGKATGTYNNHGVSGFQTIVIYGATQAGFNGAFTAWAIDANTFYYSISDPGVTTATGTPKIIVPGNVWGVNNTAGTGSAVQDIVSYEYPMPRLQARVREGVKGFYSYANQKYWKIAARMDTENYQFDRHGLISMLQQVGSEVQGGMDTNTQYYAFEALPREGDILVDYKTGALYACTFAPWTYPYGVVFTVSSVTASAGTATATTSLNHNLPTGTVFPVWVVSTTGYDGKYYATSASANTFTFPVSGSPGSSSGSVYFFFHQKYRQVNCRVDLGINIDTPANSGLTWSGGVVTVKTAQPHGLPIGMTTEMGISGVAPHAYNHIGVQATVQTANTITYPMANNPGTYTGVSYNAVVISVFKSTAGNPERVNPAPSAYMANLSGITFSSGTGLATATTASPHGRVVGSITEVLIWGATQVEYNGTFKVTITGASTFTYKPPVAPTVLTATGSFQYGFYFNAAMNTLALSSLTWASGVVTGTTAAAHNMEIGTHQTFIIQGAAPSGYNGSFTVAITGASTFTYSLTTNPGTTPATAPGCYIGPSFVMATDNIRFIRTDYRLPVEMFFGDFKSGSTTVTNITRGEDNWGQDISDAFKPGNPIFGSYFAAFQPGQVPVSPSTFVGKVIDGTSNTPGSLILANLYGTPIPAIKTGRFPIHTVLIDSWKAHGQIRTKTMAGLASAGAVTWSDVTVGDKVVSVTNLTTPGDVSSNFESNVSVSGQIQQTSGSLASSTLLFIVV